MEGRLNLSQNAIQRSKLSFLFRILWSIEQMWVIVVPSICAFIGGTVYRYSKSSIYSLTSTIACFTIWVFSRYYILGQVPVFLTPQFKECVSTVRILFRSIRTQIADRHVYSHPLIVNLGLLRSYHLHQNFQYGDLGSISAEKAYHLHRYMNFAAGAYGVLFYPHHLTSKSWSLYLKNPFLIVSSLSVEHVISQVTGIDKSDIIIAQVRGENPLKPGYYICLDRQAKAVVLVIRGTLSLSDALTDITAVGKAFLSGQAHHGISEAALNIFDEVKVILENRLQSSGYDRLIVTGHSLGGGTAVLLTLHLLSCRTEGRVDGRLGNCRLHCYAYAPPPVYYGEEEGWSNGSETWEDTITTVINGGDIIPRASLFNMYTLLLQMQHVDDLQLSLWERCRHILQGEEEKSLEGLLGGIAAAAATENRELRVFTPFAHVGEVVWVGREKQKPGVEMQKDPKKIPVLYQPCPTEWENIYLGNNFIQDHWPHDYQKTLKSLLDEIGGQL